MSCSLNSVKVVIEESILGLMKGDIRSLDNIYLGYGESA